MSLPLRACHVDFNERWLKISTTLENVLNGGMNKKVSRKEWNERFSDIYYVCVISDEPLSEKLYIHTKKFFIKHVSSIKEQLINSKDLISSYSSFWVLYYNGCMNINNLYNFLNKNFVHKKKPFELCYKPVNLIPTISDDNSNDTDEIIEILALSMIIWKNHLLLPLLNYIQNNFIENLKKFYDFDDPFHEQECLNVFINSIVFVDNFCDNIWKEFFNTNDFNHRIENEIVSFNNQFALNLIKKDDFLYYCQKSFESILNQTNFINKISGRWIEFQQQLIKCLKDCYVIGMFDQFSKNIPLIFNSTSSLETLFHYSDLPIIFKLCQSNEKVSSFFQRELINFLTNRGSVYVKTTVNLFSFKEVNEVTSILFDFIHVASGLIDFICENTTTLSTKIKDSVFENVLNYKTTQSSNSYDNFTIKLICRYIDGLLRKKIQYSLELEIYMDKSIQLIKYINDKDIFIKIYAKTLSKRLINNLNSILINEVLFISKLKMICSNDSISKLSRMYNDIRNAEDINEQFISSIKLQKIAGTANDLVLNKQTTSFDRFYFLILQSSAWPYSATDSNSVFVPPIIQTYINIFERFFKTEYETRRIFWMHQLDFGDLIYNIPLEDSTYKRVQINVDIFQLTILDIFNRVDATSKSELISTMQLGENELDLYISPLLECGIISLIKEDNKDTYILNKNYQGKNVRVHKMRSTIDEKSYQCDISVAELPDDRRLTVQASIVRIMKQAKVCVHNELISRVISENKSKFKPPISLIKENIESLIENQYLSRSSDNPDEYIYQT